MRNHDTALPEEAPAPDAQDSPLDEARRLLAEDAQQRMLACAAEIEQVLARHGMRLEVTTPQISIVPR